MAYNYVLETQKANANLISVEDATIIANAILCHMGKWQHDPQFTRGKKAFPLPTTLFDYAVQSADYMASRVELTGFAFRPTDGVSILGVMETTDTTPSVPTPLVEDISPITGVGDTVFTFGKYTGKTIRQVVTEAPDYIDWMLKQTNFKNGDILDKVKLYLQQNK